MSNLIENQNTGAFDAYISIDISCSGLRCIHLTTFIAQESGFSSRVIPINVFSRRLIEHS